MELSGSTGQVSLRNWCLNWDMKGDGLVGGEVGNDFQSEVTVLKKVSQAGRTIACWQNRKKGQ